MFSNLPLPLDWFWQFIIHQKIIPLNFQIILLNLWFCYHRLVVMLPYTYFTLFCFCGCIFFVSNNDYFYSLLLINVIREISSLFIFPKNWILDLCIFCILPISLISLIYLCPFNFINSFYQVSFGLYVHMLF